MTPNAPSSSFGRCQNLGLTCLPVDDSPALPGENLEFSVRARRRRTALSSSLMGNASGNMAFDTIQKVRDAKRLGQEIVNPTQQFLVMPGIFLA
jgi:hypothetical protein